MIIVPDVENIYKPTGLEHLKALMVLQSPKDREDSTAAPVVLTFERSRELQPDYEELLNSEPDEDDLPNYFIRRYFERSWGISQTFLQKAVDGNWLAPEVTSLKEKLSAIAELIKNAIRLNEEFAGIDATLLTRYKYFYPGFETKPIKIELGTTLDPYSLRRTVKRGQPPRICLFHKSGKVFGQRPPKGWH